MGKRIIQQARGHGSMTYRVRRQAFSIQPRYPLKTEGEMEVIRLVHSGGHSSPLAKIRAGKEIFFNFAANGIFEGQKLNAGEVGSVMRVGDLTTTTRVFNIEARPQDGGRFVRTGGNSAVVISKGEKTVKILLPSKEEKEFDNECRATIGEISGQGRLDKPVLKAGRMFYIKRTKSKLWPRTSAVKMNAIDHPFGSGRGKRIKSKIAKRNAPAGAKVGLIRPSRTGRKKH